MSPLSRALIALILALPVSARALSGGSPTCHADEILSSPMGDPIANMGYALVPSASHYRPGQAMTISLTNVDAQMGVRGLLLYVEDPDALDGEMMPIKRGNFVEPFPAGVKAVFDEYPNCNFAGLTPVLTHAGNGTKLLPLMFAWQPPAIDTGMLRIRAIALMDFGAYQMLSLDLPVDPVFNDSFE